MKKSLRCALVLLLYGLYACAGAQFNFTGGGLNRDKYKNSTLTILNFGNEAVEGPANMQLQFTEKLREYYQRNSFLKQKPSDGDLQVEGAIVSYVVAPVGAGGGIEQGAQLQRLTITVRVQFTNNVETDKSFNNQSFSFFKDFPASQNLRDVERNLVEEIFDQLAFDIFNKTVADW